MKCEELIERLWQYFESELPDDQRQAVEEHAGSCPACGPLLQKCGELTCRDFTEFLHDYLEDQLPAERKTIFERHLTVCQDCVAYLDAYRKSTALARSQAESTLEDVPPDLIRAVLDSWSDPEE